jgi:hypothetical protein
MPAGPPTSVSHLTDAGHGNPISPVKLSMAGPGNLPAKALLGMDERLRMGGL